ncbi:schwannomin-interacting protein 1-like isoform X5 [Xiphophorus maculatus]|uniref:schwannomin-interacting protein 1-like isoform X5 n=1 Tax=Xiphophorus maculatus TaxID=8083 RepID=UPI000C6D60FA|nr:schwannomin-interacting protein 1-like isoform X5 [Xiphophorus maculatus]
MEGEKEKQWEQQEEKESNEAEDDTRSDDETCNEVEDGNSERAVTVWQEGHEKDELGNPIMHWEALSLCIAELEKQEEEKKAKAGASLERDGAPRGRTEDRGRTASSWDDGSDACNSHVLALTSRLHTQMNLQLCFINNSESEEEEDEEPEKDVCSKKSSSSWKRTAPTQKNSQNPSMSEEPKSRGFRNTLRNLRDRLRTDQRKKTAGRREAAAQRTHLELSDVERLSVQQLTALCASLRQDIQDLSSELVSRLHIRDQLRTEQDAMLLEKPFQQRMNAYSSGRHSPPQCSCRYSEYKLPKFALGQKKHPLQSNPAGFVHLAAESHHHFTCQQQVTDMGVHIQDGAQV